MLEVTLVGPITEWLILRQTATADRNKLSAAKSVLIALLVNYFEFTLNAEGAIAIYCYFCLSHCFAFSRITNIAYLWHIPFAPKRE